MGSYRYLQFQPNMIGFILVFSLSLLVMSFSNSKKPDFHYPNTFIYLFNSPVYNQSPSLLPLPPCVDSVHSLLGLCDPITGHPSVWMLSYATQPDPSHWATLSLLRLTPHTWPPYIRGTLLNHTVVLTSHARSSPCRDALLNQALINCMGPFHCRDALPPISLTDHTSCPISQGGNALITQLWL